ncbi:hypothetical protein [Zunongwangia endophytica]|uniref:Uncharacterized protein n=1 Tax=Zunongwangia endophytica TaxID=1808945 RepID=A0ABV8HAH3_9FLAO|nr:hypothetical protein [Zunongwangia endophytica]MDN3593271.1 hypothetical protein [Zunongwangia endophytica]MDN3594228.1 hypothetical protein [Zunongwangia endophytica]
MVKKIDRRPNINKKLRKAYDKLESLKKEIEKKEIPDDILNQINHKIEKINDFEGNDRKLVKFIENSCSEILKMLNKRLGITTINYHENNWLSIGIGVFGLPIGVICYVVTKNPVFIALGLPLGMSIGLTIGILKDRKAKNYNKQIQLEQ